MRDNQNRKINDSIANVKTEKLNKGLQMIKKLEKIYNKINKCY